MTELKARTASELKSFQASVLQAFGGREPKLFEREFASSFRIKIEIDKIEFYIHDLSLPSPFRGALIKTIASEDITTVIFNRGLKLTHRTGLYEFGDVFGAPIFSPFRLLVEDTEPFAVARNDVMQNDDSGSFQNTRTMEVNGNWKMSFSGAQTGVTGPLPQVQTATGAELQFDTIGIAIRGGPYFNTSFTAPGVGFGPLRGGGMDYVSGFPDGINDALCAWFYDASENPTFPDPSEDNDGVVAHTFGKLIFESL